MASPLTPVEPSGKAGSQDRAAGCQILTAWGLDGAAGEFVFGKRHGGRAGRRIRSRSISRLSRSPEMRSTPLLRGRQAGSAMGNPSRNTVWMVLWVVVQSIASVWSLRISARMRE